MARPAIQLLTVRIRNGVSELLGDKFTLLGGVLLQELRYWKVLHASGGAVTVVINNLDEASVNCVINNCIKDGNPKW